LYDQKDVYITLTEDEALGNLREYGVLGVPGCIGCGDVVHVPW
jgi:hypothetical protein